MIEGQKKATLNDRAMWMATCAEFVEETCKEGCQTDHFQQHQNMRGLLLYACASGAKVKQSMFLCEVALGEPQVVRKDGQIYHVLLFPDIIHKVCLIQKSNAALLFRFVSFNSNMVRALHHCHSA